MPSDLNISLRIRAINQASSVIRQVGQSIKSLQDRTRDLQKVGASLAVGGAALAGVGAAIALPLKGAVSAASEVNAALAHLSTTLDTGVQGSRELAEAQKFAADMSVRFNYSQKEIIDNLYRTKSFGLAWKDAIDATNVSLAVAKGNLGDATQIGEQLAIIFNDFGSKTAAAGPQLKQFGDIMAYATRNFAFEDVNQLNEALSVSIGSAKAAGIGFKDLVATISAFQEIGLKGASAGTAIEESLQAFARGKLNVGAALARTSSGSLDLIQTFVNLRRELGSGAISLAQFQESAKALGIRGSRALAVNVNDLVDIQRKLNNPALVQGAAMAGAATMLGAFQEQVGSLGKAFTNLGVVVGNSLLGPLTGVVKVLASAVTHLTSFAQRHAELTKFIVAFTAIGAGLAIVVGGIAAAVGGLILLGTMIGIPAAIAGAIAGIGVAIAGVGAFILTFHSQIGFVLSTIADTAKAVGQDIWSAITWPFTHFADFIKAAYRPIGDAMSGLAGVIGRFIKGGSPIPEGPLHDLNLGRDLAYTLRPSPLIDKMRSVAAAVAISAPLMLTPSMAGAAVSPAMPSNGSAPVTVNYVINVSGAVGDPKDIGDAVVAAIKKHDGEVSRILFRHSERRRRLEY